MPPVYHDRVLALGFTGSGKSELLNVMFSEVRCQKLLVDSKWEFAIDDADGRPIEPVHDPADIDWSQPVILYRDRTGTAAEFNDLFERCYRRRGLVVCVHELADICEESPGKTPRHFNSYCAKGRAHGLGLLAGSQRPFNVPKRAFTEADHIYVLVPGLVNPDDHVTVAKAIGMEHPRLRSELNLKHAQLGDYAYLEHDRKARETVFRPPLPDHLRRKNVVKRTSFV